MILLTIDGETLTTTAEQPFYTISGEWVNAGDLEIGEEIVSIKDGSGTVESVAVVVDPQPMYNLTVDEAHTFFVAAGESLVHNCADIRLARDSQTFDMALGIGKRLVDFANSFEKPVALTIVNQPQLNDLIS